MVAGLKLTGLKLVPRKTRGATALGAKLGALPWRSSALTRQRSDNCKLTNIQHGTNGRRTGWRAAMQSLSSSHSI
jgi:endonuclease/exonuclease/phosphatase (EEP) superfamily protein YafD